MTHSRQSHITDLLIAWRDGDQHALEKLVPLVYDELRRQAARYLRRERLNHSLQPTALVHEVYLRLINEANVQWQNRAHFFAIAARMMREILVDHARARQAQKRGGTAETIQLDEAVAIAAEPEVNLLELDAALTKLEMIDAQKSRMVELRFFSGLSIEETAEVMGISPRGVNRQWQTVKAWLHREMSKGSR
ncbi:MAG TPA: sigma-70 family RNA polymerase sigma factor [Pyrinomonadaceae bacterium]